MSKKSKSAMQGTKLKMALGLSASSYINCADNSGAKTLNIFAAKIFKVFAPELSAQLIREYVLRPKAIFNLVPCIALLFFLLIF